MGLERKPGEMSKLICDTCRQSTSFAAIMRHVGKELAMCHDCWFGIDASSGQGKGLETLTPCGADEESKGEALEEVVLREFCLRGS